MPIHITFNNLKQSDAVSEHVNELMKEIIKITDDRFAFHISLSRENNAHTVVINCHYRDKPLISKAKNANLYRAISKSVDSIRSQVIRKTQKLRSPSHHVAQPDALKE